MRTRFCYSTPTRGLRHRRRRHARQRQRDTQRRWQRTLRLARSSRARAAAALALARSGSSAAYAKLRQSWRQHTHAPSRPHASANRKEDISPVASFTHSIPHPALHYLPSCPWMAVGCLPPPRLPPLPNCLGAAAHALRIVLRVCTRTHRSTSRAAPRLRTTWHTTRTAGTVRTHHTHTHTHLARALAPFRAHALATATFANVLTCRLSPLNAFSLPAFLFMGSSFCAAHTAAFAAPLRRAAWRCGNMVRSCRAFCRRTTARALPRCYARRSWRCCYTRNLCPHTAAPLRRGTAPCQPCAVPPLPPAISPLLLLNTCCFSDARLLLLATRTTIHAHCRARRCRTLLYTLLYITARACRLACGYMPTAAHACLLAPLPLLCRRACHACA